MLDTDLWHLLNTKTGSAESKAESHPEIIYSFAKERFGVEDHSTSEKPHKGPSRRQKAGSKLRKEIKKLKAAYLEAPEEEKEGIQELQ